VESPPQERDDEPPRDAAQVAVSSAPAQTRCPYCHDDLQPGAKLSACELCGTDHHTDCFRQGCAVYGCPGAPNARAPLTPLRVAVWTMALTWAALMGVLIGGEAQQLHRLAGQLIGAAVLVGFAVWLLRRVDRANAAARLQLATPHRQGRTRRDTTEEALDIITLGGIGGANQVQQVLDDLAADAPPPCERPPSALPPSTCGECGEALEPPEGKEEPDWFCYHCGAELSPVDPDEGGDR